MENNQENVQNEVNNVEQKVNENKPQKSGKVTTVVLMIIVLALAVAIGLCGGYWLSNKNRENVTDDNENKVEQSTENKVENTTGKKVDESKEWVYDAEYLKEKEEKKKDEFKSSKEIKLPYININSEDARLANEEIKILAERAYQDFGKLLQGATVDYEPVTNENWYTFTRYNYEQYINGNILSVVIAERKITVPGDAGVAYIIYNFNLETLKSVDLADIVQSYGFKSEAYLQSKLNIELKNSEARGEGLSPTDTVWDGKRFFIRDNKINLVVPGPANGEVFVEMDPNVTEITKEETNTENQTSNSNKSSYKEEYIKIIEKVQSEYPNTDIQCDLIYFNNDDIPDLVIGLPGYWVSLYIYENGTIYNPIEEWSYGMMGNAGYLYSEKKGIVSNHNSDFAGAISTDSILILNSKKEFDTLSSRGEELQYQKTILSMKLYKKI